MPRPAPSPYDLSPRLRPYAATVAFVALALAAYSHTFSAGFIWGDDAYISENPLLRDANGLGRIWFEPTGSPQYYPLAFTSFWVECQVWGPQNPGVFHSTNVLLHGLNGVLLWRVLKRLGVPVPGFVAGAFVLHPVHVESVAWVAQRTNVLSASFYLGAALAYFRFSPPAFVAATSRRRWRWYALAVGLFVCALLSKSVTCSLPAAVLVVHWWKRGRIGWRDVLPLLPLFAVGLASALNTAWLEKVHVEAKGQDWALTPADRVLVAGRAVCHYADTLLCPANLTFIYPRWEVDARVWWQWLFPVGVLGAVVGLWVARKRIGRGPLAGVLFFVGTLVPTLGFVDVYPFRFSFVADHFQYLASIGLLAVLVAGGSTLWQRYRPADKVVLQVAWWVVMAPLGVLTFYYTLRYESAQTLWEDTLERNPDAWIAHYNLGEILFEQGNYADAEVHFRAAVRLKPEEAVHHFKLGKAIRNQNRVEESEEHFREAIRLDPDYTMAHFNLGMVLWKRKEYAAAAGEFREALRIQPGFAAAHGELGLVLIALKKTDQAVTHLRTAAELAPNSPQIQYAAGLGLAQLGNKREALPLARRAAELNPGDSDYLRLLQTLETEVGGRP